MSWRTLRLLCVCAALAASAVPACGGSASDSNLGRAGGGSGGRLGAGGNGSVARAGTSGTAGSAQPAPVSCGTAMCRPVVIPFPVPTGFTIPGCCADAETNHCGLDSSVLAMVAPTFSEACQPLAQPGSADSSCPNSPKVALQDSGVTIDFPGCCRPDHTCGYQLNSIAGAFKLGLGCVDSTPFLDGGAPQPCGETGAAGAAGAAGTAGDGSGAGAGGDSSGAAGTAGESASSGASG